MNFLLINYDFPPNPGIGGRRWAKLAKALAMDGHRIFVIKAETPDNVTASPWSQDVQHPNIQVFSAARIYPKALSHPKRTVLARAQYKFYQWLLKLQEDGTIYDQSIGWDKKLMPMAKEIIKSNEINVIIATGAPWNLLVYAAELKRQFPTCTLLADYRDPWLTARNYGMANLAAKRKNVESNKQKFVFEHADIITTPYDYLTQQLKDWSLAHCNHQPKFETIAHFFDSEDFEQKGAQREKDNEFRLVYAGDMYIGSEPQWQQFGALVKTYLQSAQQKKKQLRIDIYTSAFVPAFLHDIRCIAIHSPIGKSIFKVMQEADALLVVLPDNKKDELTTKFYEYLPLRKPTLMVASTGEATHFVTTHQLGIQAVEANEDVADFLEGNFVQHRFNVDFELSSHTSAQRAQQVLTLVK